MIGFKAATPGSRGQHSIHRPLFSHYLLDISQHVNNFVYIMLSSTWKIGHDCLNVIIIIIMIIDCVGLFDCGFFQYDFTSSVY